MVSSARLSADVMSVSFSVVMSFGVGMFVVARFTVIKSIGVAEVSCSLIVVNKSTIVVLVIILALVSSADLA